MKQPFSLPILRGIWVAVVLIGLASGLVIPLPVVAITLLDSADYTFVYPNLPDPAVWSVSAQGNVTQVPIDGTGLAMGDPDNLAELMYGHPTPFLTGDPNDPNFHNTATFRVRAMVPYVFDGSLAWWDHAIGWRMIVDDGVHRLELALSRDAFFARKVWLDDCPSFVPMPFPWDNELTNTYEIRRLSNGDYEITLANEDPLAPGPFTRTILAGQLPPSNGTPMFAWGSTLYGGGAYYWVEAHAEVSGPMVTNQPPVAGPIAAPLDPIPVNTAISASAPFSDPDVADTHTALWDWGDGSTSPGVVSEANGAGSAGGDHTYAAAGIYPLTLTISDDTEASASTTFQYLVVYDPSAGFVTGGGWIDSPAGAYKPDPALSGKATFGFVSKYQKGATVPTGKTEFQFHAASLDFKSSSYEWLVVNQGGTNAQFKGSGTIDGTGSYKFMLWAGDGAPDSFRIKIWEEPGGVEAVVYDNGIEQPIGGGSIIVHKD
ncbi:MAG: PKD domain-containing protein [Anaerolineales bacterium]